MIDNVNVVSFFSCSSSSDGVLHMEVDKVADEVANMVVDMEVDKVADVITDMVVKIPIIK